MKFVKIAGSLLLFIHLIGIQKVFADEISDNGSASITMKDFLMFEAANVVISLTAASSPNVYGGYLAVVTSLVFLTQDFEARHNGRVYWLSGLIAMGTVAIYNLSIDENSVADIDVFRNNFMALNLLFAIDIYLGEYFSPKKNKSYSYSIIPLNGGGYAQLSYRF